MIVNSHVATQHKIELVCEEIVPILPEPPQPMRRIYVWNNVFDDG